MRAAFALLLVATTAAAAPKKDRPKTTQHPAPPAAGTKPVALVNLYNEWTHEWLAVDAKSPPATAAVDHFLRDHYTNKWTQMDGKLIHVLLDAAAHFHSPQVHVVSGFRHPKFNLILRKKGHQVARDSEHSHGHAVDFFIPKVATRDLHAWAKDQKIGGVGLYMESGFVHMDTGSIRFWSGD